MSMRKLIVAAALTATALATFLATFLATSGVALAQDSPFSGKAQFGKPATPEEVESWNITVAPDGVGLPHGSGTAKQGESVYTAKCQACHGEKGNGGSALRLAGIKGTVGNKDTTVKTIGTFWPYATTIFDYVFTSMPFRRRSRSPMTRPMRLPPICCFSTGSSARPT